MGGWFGGKSELKKEKVSTVVEGIQPGQSRAIVTLADGKQVVLEQANRKIKESDGRCYIPIPGHLFIRQMLKRP